MTLSLKHAFQSSVPDDGDEALVQPSNWNAEHTLSLASHRVVGRDTSGAGAAEEVTLSQLLDWIGSAAQGDILYRGATGWSRLAAGTSGHFLQSQGVGANPQWAAVAGGLAVGTTAISGGTDGRVLFDNNGTLGEYAVSGSGNVALTTNPSFTTPTLGVASATSINKVAFTAPATGATLTIADGKTLTANASITLAGTDATTMTFPSTSQSIAGLAVANTWTATQTITPAANTSALVVTGYSVTGSGTTALMSWAGTWNTSGTPTAIDLNITDTSSNSDSLLLRLRVGGWQRMAVRKDGQIRVGSPTGSLASIGGATALLLAAGTTFQMAAENQASSGPSAGAGVGLYSNDNAAMASGDRLGFFLFGGSPSSGSLVSSALIGAFATQTWSGSAYGTRIEFQTTADSTTSRTTKMILSSGGILVLGSTLASTVPALKPSSTVLQARLGDDSDFAPLQGRLRSNANATAETPTATHTLRMFDAAGTEYKVLAVAA